jgi:U4/U6.U5 tri-snRNP-associated protein 1
MVTEAHNPDSEDVFMEEDVAPAPSEQEQKVKDSGWAEVKDVIHDEKMADVEEEVKPDETIHESSLGKGLSGALQLLKDRGTLKDTVEWGGRNMDKKKSKLVGIVNENDDKKEIRIERTDEYGRIVSTLYNYFNTHIYFILGQMIEKSIILDTICFYG